MAKDDAHFRAVCEWFRRCTDLVNDGYVEVFTSAVSDGYVRKLRHGSNGRVVMVKLNGTCVTQLSSGNVVFSHDYEQVGALH